VAQNDRRVDGIDLQGKDAMSGEAENDQRARNTRYVRKAVEAVEAVE
jgi:hypothetical protein